MTENSNISKKSIIALLMILLLTLTMFGGSQAVATEPAVQQTTAEKLYAAAESSVFYVRAKKDGVVKSTGTGFCIDKTGTALTACHVVSDVDFTVTAVFDDGRELPVKVLYRDSSSDAAVLQLPKGTYSLIPTATQTPKNGANVCAIGYAFKTSKLITDGIVNDPDAIINGERKLLVSCEMINGMSGGPVLGADGKAIGIVSASVRTMTGIYLSVGTEDMNKAINCAKGGK